MAMIQAQPGYAEGDAVVGKLLFQQCTYCHAVGPGAQHQFGPSLNGVLNRDAGTAEAYDYSSAFRKAVQAGLNWDNDTLDRFLQAPMSVVKGTKMAFQGMRSADERADVIAYLASIDSDGVSVSTDQITVPVPVPEVEPDDEVANSPNKWLVPLARDVPVPKHGVLHLGRPALEQEIKAWNIDIRPDGAGLPAGSGSVTTGGELYDAQCAGCHGVFGEGEGRWPVLAGGQGTLTDERPVKTIGSYWPYLSTVFDYVRRAMPFGNARSLSDDDVYALTAYLLYLNDLVDENFTLTSENFSAITLPNADNFIVDNRYSEPQYGTSEELCMKDCIPGAVKVTQRARILDVTPDIEDDEGSEASGGAID